MKWPMFNICKHMIHHMTEWWKSVPMVPHMVYFDRLVTIQRQFINVQYRDTSKIWSKHVSLTGPLEFWIRKWPSADIYCVRVLFCMSDHHDVHCTCPSPHQCRTTDNCHSYQSHEQVITWMWLCYLLWNNQYFITNLIYIINPKPVIFYYSLCIIIM